MTLYQKLKTEILVVFLFVLALIPVQAQEIGLQLYSLRNEFKKDVPGTFAKIKEWGITKLEDGNDGTHGYTMAAYKAMLAENNLEIVSASASFEELRDNPQQALDRALQYGAKYMVCFWIPHVKDKFGMEDTKKAIRVFNKVGKMYKQAGVTVAYHPHGYEFGRHKDKTLMDYMIQKSKYFDFEMDVYWFALPGEDPVAWLRRYPNKFKLMHLKDCEKGTAVDFSGHSDVENNVVLGTGQLDMVAIVEEAKKLKIEYLFLEDESSRVIQQIPLSLDYLKSLE